MSGIDRKAAIRKYKETARPAGIFAIRNTATGKTYIAASPDIPSALNRDQASLRLGGHPHKELQQDWNRHGADAFTFETLDTLTASEDASQDVRKELKVLEAMWREKLATEGEIYKPL